MKPTRPTSSEENLPDSLKNLPLNDAPKDPYEDYEDAITRALEKFVKEQKKSQQQDPDEVVLDGAIRTLKKFLKEKERERKKKKKVSTEKHL